MYIHLLSTFFSLHLRLSLHFSNIRATLFCSLRRGIDLLSHLSFYTSEFLHGTCFTPAINCWRLDDGHYHYYGPDRIGPDRRAVNWLQLQQNHLFRNETLGASHTMRQCCLWVIDLGIRTGSPVSLPNPVREGWKKINVIVHWGSTADTLWRTEHQDKACKSISLLVICYCCQTCNLALVTFFHVKRQPKCEGGGGDPPSFSPPQN